MIQRNDKPASFPDENWRVWSGLRDLNPRSPGPKPGAIPNFAKPGYSVEDIAVVVKYVVKEIIPHFQETFKSGYWGKLGRNRGVCNISGSRTNSVLQLPNQARYQTSLSPDIQLEFLGMWSNMWSKAILDQSRGEVKKKSASAATGFLVG